MAMVDSVTSARGPHLGVNTPCAIWGMHSSS